MRPARLILAALLGAAATAPAAALDLMDRGAYAVYRDGRPAGTEEFEIALLDGAGTIRANTSVRVVHDAQVRDIRQTSTLVLDRNLVPRSYKLTSEVGVVKQSLDVEFKLRLAICRYDLGTGQKSEAAVLAPDVTVLDDNVFCHWAVLLSRYNMDLKGAQTVPVFIPQLGERGAGPMVIDYLGRERTEGVKGRPHRFRVRSPHLTVSVWSDDGRVLKLQVPENRAEVIRVMGE
jgi:hypothetical protein